jgi:hypothetical protein
MSASPLAKYLMARRKPVLWKEVVCSGAALALPRQAVYLLPAWDGGGTHTKFIASQFRTRLAQTGNLVQV